MDLLMGVDVGTTRVKTLLFDLRGMVVGQAGQNVVLLHPREEWVEQDAEVLWRAVVDTARQAMDQAPRTSRVLGLSLSTQTGTLVPVDEAGQPLRMAFSWMDHRAHGVMQTLEERLDPESIYCASGWRLTAASVLAHIEWLRQCEPEFYHASRYFLQLNDFLIYRMTGLPRQDPSVAGYSGLYDILRNRWNPQALSAVGISPHRLPRVVPAGASVGLLRPGVAAQMGLSPEVMVVNGPHDQYAAAFGAGVLHSGQVLLSCGTAWVVMVVTAEPSWSSGAAVSRHVVPGRWGALQSMGGVGTTVEWYLDTILAPHSGSDDVARSSAYEDMDLGIARIPVGARGLFCSPIAGTPARQRGGGMLWGLTARHGPYDIARAVFEGIAFELRALIESMEAHGVEIRSLVMVGGASRSRSWPQIIADVTGLPVLVPAVEEAGARGAAMLAGVGLGCFSAEEAFGGLSEAAFSLESRESAHEQYDELFCRYQAVPRALDS